MNTANNSSKGCFKLLQNGIDTCGYYKAYNSNDKFEWDPNKSDINRNKHGIGFERIHDLYKDEFMLQMVEKPEKWENLSNLPDHVEKNVGNTDPVRAKLIGVIDGKIYTAIYTFRGDVGEMKCRIISLRRADTRESQSYERLKSLTR